MPAELVQEWISLFLVSRPKQPVIGFWLYFNTNVLFVEILLEPVEGLILRIEMIGCLKAKCV